MSSTSSPGNPEAEHDTGDDNGDAIVVLTPDTATLEAALAARAAKRQAIASKKRQAATDKQAFVCLSSFYCSLDLRTDAEYIE
jgi:hypothetical protein